VETGHKSFLYLIRSPHSSPLCFYLCLSVCLYECSADYSKSCERIMMKLFGSWAWPKKQSIRCWWRSGAHFLFSWIFTMILYLLLAIHVDSQEIRIKHEHPRRRYELSECFLVCFVECGPVLRYEQPLFEATECTILPSQLSKFPRPSPSKINESVSRVHCLKLSLSKHRQTITFCVGENVCEFSR